MKRLAVLAAAAAAVVIGMGGTASAASGPNSVTLRQTNPTGRTTVVSVGVINATGRDVVLSDTEDKFVYPEGNIFVTHTPTSFEDHSKPGKCIFDNEEEGTYVVTGGTGDYRGAEGQGKYEAHITATGCGKTPKTFLLVVHASGTLDIDNN